MSEEVFTIYDIIRAEYNLEPLECLACRSGEVIFIQSIGDAICQDCNRWQLDIQEVENEICY